MTNVPDIFTAEDFLRSYEEYKGGQEVRPEWIAQKANLIFREWLEKEGLVVYSNLPKSRNTWHDRKYLTDNSTAFLLFPREIEK